MFVSVVHNQNQTKTAYEKHHYNMVVRQLLTERLHSLKHEPLYYANENNTLRSPNNLINVIN